MALPTVIIVSGIADWHAQAVSAALERFELARPLVIDSYGLAASGGLAIETDATGSFGWVPGLVPAAQDVVGLWWRRPRLPDAPTLSSSESDFAKHAWIDALEGFAATVANVINAPWADRRAARKTLQLQAAVRSGLNVPKTLTTNNMQRVREFHSAMGGRIVAKAFRSPDDQVIEARLIESEDLAHDQALALAPTIFQEWVDGDSDIRVTVVDERVFAARISPRTRMVDFRMEPDPMIEQFSLDKGTSDRLCRLMRDLDIRYCSADFRLRPDGTPVFLDLNPGGQYLFIEKATGLPITRALAESLAAWR